MHYKILIVDDEKMMTELLLDHLKDCGYERTGIVHVPIWFFIIVLVLLQMLSLILKSMGFFDYNSKN